MNREFRLYTASKGRGSGLFTPANDPSRNSQHAWAAIVEDLEGNTIWSSEELPAEFTEGYPDKGHFYAVLAALPHLPENSVCWLVAKEKSALYWPFKPTHEGKPSPTPWLKADGKRYKPESLIREIHRAATERGIELMWREPQGSHEQEQLCVPGDKAVQRRDDAEEASQKPEDKF